jgi:hypothetical protein
MYFPQLRRLGSYNINPLTINMLDSWLAVQRRAVLKNLSPIRFSLQSNVDTELAIDMFSLSSESSIGVLKAIFKPICPYCSFQNGHYGSLDDVPDVKIECRHCGDFFVPSSRLDLIEIVFERCLEPEQPLIDENARGQNNNHGGNRGNGESLRASDIINHPNNARRHLLSKLDSRYEAAQ